MTTTPHRQGVWARRVAGWQHPVLLALVVVLLAALAVFQSMAGAASDRAVDEAEVILDRAEVTIHNWFARYRPLPALIARDPAIVAALSGDPQPGALDGLSRDLAERNRIAGTLDTYLLRADGTTVAASNWQDTQTFVGQNYGFRPYYTEAIAGRETEFFGLGTVSGLRGYYLSAPVRDGERIIGVVVIKVSIAALEAALDYGSHSVFVTDEAGVAILSDNPALALTATRPVTADERHEIATTRRYDLDAIAPAPLTQTGGVGGGQPILRAPSPNAADTTRAYLELSQPMDLERWQVHLLYDLGALRTYLWSLGTAIFASAVAATALVTLALQRRRSLIDRLADRERSEAELARRVSERTAELTQTNRRLEDEVADRRATEDTLRQTQNELVQAGKLAALGQMSAALSHEFNQPLTAIRTYTENASAFYEAGRPDRAGENLARVLRLTEKVAQLSKHLTRFARRTGDDVVPVALDPVIAEALELLAARIDRSGAAVTVTGATGMVVMGGATRLQHVLMNLITNAIDATAPDRPPQIAIAVDDRLGHVEITVTDTGDGIPADTLPQIFDPFFTTKEVGQGLGLGLSICFNIIDEFGGTIRAANRDGGGACFTIILRDATAIEVAAQ